MPDNNERKPNPNAHEGGVDETVHAGCGLPVALLATVVIGLLILA